MKITFYGTRGSIPVCDPHFIGYGGNTTCLLFEFDDGNLSICDAGTGIRQLGKDLLKKKAAIPNCELTIFFTHFHWDHIQGFPFFGPAYDPDFHICIHAIGEERKRLDVPSLFKTQMQSAYFPIPLDKMGARFSFEYMQGEKIIWKNKVITVLKHQHPGDAYSFRFDTENGKSFVFCTDIEHGETIDQRVVELSRNADVLIHEAHFTPEKLSFRGGWGHSSWEQAVEVAKQANVKQLYLTHHDPDHDDDFLDQLEEKCQQYFPCCQLAKDGIEIII